MNNKKTYYYEIVREPIITEKSLKMIEDFNRYTFKVDGKTNKVEIKKAIEEIFGVTVVKVNTITVKPKFKRLGKHEGFKSGYKKAIVELAEGQTIDAFNI